MSNVPDEELPPKPEPPDPSDCCKSDCSPCVFEVYDRQVEQWEKRVAEILERRKSGTNRG